MLRCLSLETWPREGPCLFLFMLLRIKNKLFPDRALPVKFLAILLLTSFWLIYLRPYHGIRHDSILYLGQALLLNEPQLAQDLFFAYGSQSQYTLFPELIARLLQIFRPSELFRALTLCSLVAFTLASWALIKTLFAVPFRLWALLGVLLLPMGYGPYGIFSYGEPFFTGRSLAEPLVLASIAAWFASRHVLASLCWIAALLLHPLQAMVVPALVFSALVWRDRRWCHLLWLVVPLAVAVVLDVAHLGRFALRMDPQWAEWVKEYTPQVFISSWDFRAWGYLLTDIFLGWLVVRHTTGKLRQLAISAIMATILGLLAALVLADGLRLALAAGAQLWRVQWLLHWLAMACVPWLLALQWRAPDTGKHTRWALLLCIVAMGTRVGGQAPSPLVALLLIPVYLQWPRLQALVSTPRLLPAIHLFPWLLLLSATLKYAAGIWQTFKNVGYVYQAARPEFMLVSNPLVSGALLSVIVLFWLRVDRARILIMVFGMLALVYAGTVWDRRSQWTQYIESAEYSPNLFGVKLDDDAQVFWEDETLAPWIILRRPQYFGQEQTAGVVFNRKAAAELIDRNGLLGMINFQKQICKLMNGFSSNGECTPDESLYAEICASANPPKYLVLTFKLRVAALGKWEIVGGRKGDQNINYYLYACSDFSPYLAHE